MTITADEFRTARQLTRHSQAEVAKVLGVSRSTINRYETGDREPPREIYDWLCLNRNNYGQQALTPLGQRRGEHRRGERAQAIASLRELKEVRRGSELAEVT